MSTNMDSARLTDLPRSSSGPRVDRIVVGLLIGAVGVGWLFDQAGVSVPWRMFPAAAVVIIGLALLATLLGGRGRGALVGLGIILTAVAVAVGVGADRYAGPVGDLVVAPTVAEWPVQQHISAGTVTVDLTRHPMPEAGQLQVDVGAGRIILVLPAEATAGINASATAGTITLDGVKVGDGLDVRWVHPSNSSPSSSVQLELHVGLGDIEVNHE
jgi:hypothetical protein